MHSAALGLDDKEASRQRCHPTRRVAGLGKDFFFFIFFFLLFFNLQCAKPLETSGGVCVGNGGPRDESRLQRQAGLLLVGELSRCSLSRWGRGWRAAVGGSEGTAGGSLGSSGIQESG